MGRAPSNQIGGSGSIASPPYRATVAFFCDPRFTRPGEKIFAHEGAECQLVAVELPIGSSVVPFWGSYSGSYKVIPQGTTMEPMGNHGDRETAKKGVQLFEAVRIRVRDELAALVVSAGMVVRQEGGDCAHPKPYPH